MVMEKVRNGCEKKGKVRLPVPTKRFAASGGSAIIACSLSGVTSMSRGPHPLSANARNEGRPVQRRTRTFRPNYLSFAGTYQCKIRLT
jgi:hypothetical protein